MKLADAEPLIREALVRLMTLPAAARPFVIADGSHLPGAHGQHFVQFRGSDGEELLIDVPFLPLTEPCTPETGAARAVALFRSWLCPESAELTLEENTTLQSHDPKP